MWQASLDYLNPHARIKLHGDAPVQPATTPVTTLVTTSAAMPGASAVVTADESETPSIAAATPFRPGRWDIWTLGLAIGLGGQYFSWNAGLRDGLYTYMLIYLVVGLAYITLCCCTSEITGALPFAGGAYGLSRCTLGLYAGFIIGCAEALEYIVYVSTSVLALANMLTESVPAVAGFEPLIWMLFYTSSLVVHIRGGYVFWRWNMLIGVLSLFFVLLYCIGSFPHTNFRLNADNDLDFRYVHGARGFLRSLPLSCWFFVGVEALSLASDDVLTPTTAIPFAQVACILALFVTGVVVLFVTVSLPPPGLKQVSKLLAPFDNGFQLLFNISVETATLFSIPAMYATTFGFMWGYGKLIAAMATSKLLPPILARPHPTYGTAHYALLAGSVLSYGVCLLVFYTPAILDAYIFNICIAMAFLGYAAQCVGYIALKRSYPRMDRSAFRSPFGVAGAIYSLVVWLAGLVSIAGCQDNGGIEIAAVACILATLTLVYVGYAQSRQTLSAKEHKVFLMAHVMMKFKSDTARRRRYAPYAMAAQQRRSGSPTRLIAATGLVRPAARSLVPLGRRDNGSCVPLALPVASSPLLLLADPTPFLRQFTAAPPADPYTNDDDDDGEHTHRSGALSAIEMAVAATDGVCVAPMRLTSRRTQLHARSCSDLVSAQRVERDASTTHALPISPLAPSGGSVVNSDDVAAACASETNEIDNEDQQQYTASQAVAVAAAAAAAACVLSQSSCSGEIGAALSD